MILCKILPHILQSQLDQCTVSRGRRCVLVLVEALCPAQVITSAVSRPRLEQSVSGAKSHVIGCTLVCSNGRSAAGPRLKDSVQARLSNGQFVLLVQLDSMGSDAGGFEIKLAKLKPKQAKGFWPRLEELLLAAVWWLTCCCCYQCRKPFGFTKPNVKEDWSAHKKVKTCPAQLKVSTIDKRTIGIVLIWRSAICCLYL